MNAYKKKKCKAKPPAQPTASKSQRDKNFLHGKQPDEAPLSVSARSMFLTLTDHV